MQPMGIYSMKFLSKKAKENKENAKPKKEKVVTQKEATFDFINASKEFEKSRIDDIEKSRVIAWRVAIGACTLAICCVIAIVFLMPLKEVKPYVIRVDNNTGATDIVSMLDGTKSSNYGEQVAKYFASLYVTNMEGYDWYTIQKQVDTLMLFSDNAMQQRVSNKFSLPTAPHKVYKDKNRIEIKINNTSIIDDKGLMQVRFTTKVVPMNGGVYNAQSDTYSSPIEEKNYIATIGFEYINVPTLDAIRLVNPLGFTVKSYRVDQDGI